MADDLAELRARLERRAGGPVDIREAQPVEILQIDLRSTFERRSVEMRFRPAAEEGLSIGRLPEEPVNVLIELDPWARSIEGAPAGREWKTFRVLRDRATEMTCPLCAGAGARVCGTCRGKGEFVADNRRFWCDDCRRAGHRACDACGTSGRATGIPVLHVERTIAEAREVLADPAPSPELLAALWSRPSPGRVVYEEEDEPRLEPRLGGGAGGGAYRGETLRYSKPVNDVVNQMLTRSPPEGTRLAAQQVRVSRFTGFRVRGPWMREFWAIGDPPLVWPPDAI